MPTHEFLPEPPVKALPFVEMGERGDVPLIFLHGFAGDTLTWLNLQTALQTKRRTISFDLPGHGKALDWPRIGHAGVSAKAVSSSLDALDLERVHLIGHSMGGAVAALTALQAPERIASMTLLAPGGFGSEINHQLLRRFAKASALDEIEPLLEQFFGFEHILPRKLAAHVRTAHARPGAIETLQEIAEAILDGLRQRTLDLDALAALNIPTKVIWGVQDRVLPVRQAQKLPGLFAAHIFEGVGHMPHLEEPQAVAQLILQNTDRS